MKVSVSLLVTLPTSIVTGRNKLLKDVSKLLLVFMTVPNSPDQRGRDSRAASVLLIVLILHSGCGCCSRHIFLLGTTHAPEQSPDTAEEQTQARVIPWALWMQLFCFRGEGICSHRSGQLRGHPGRHGPVYRLALEVAALSHVNGFCSSGRR